MSNRSQTFVAMFLGFWIVLLHTAGCRQEKIISIQSSSIQRLNRIVEKQGALIDWHGRRLTQLERPNEPVHQPRNPGRLSQIGSAN